VFVVAEAFAATCLRFQRDLALDEDRWNPHGGTMTLGHAFGATGAILVAEAVELLEAGGGRRAIAAVSGAAGVGVAVLIDRDLGRVTLGT
ncbi:MAG: acetyl-CoA C-acyltransferase, partial [Deltaproteobacteria bacterium]|nr:acetyl-CoA C-acyltransferase [Deltaproteobacteria bacterium]